MNRREDPSGAETPSGRSDHAGQPHGRSAPTGRLGEQDLVAIIPLIRAWAKQQKVRMDSPQVETASILDSAFASVLPKVRAGDFEHAGQLVNWLKKAVENEIRGRRRAQRRDGIALEEEASAKSSFGPSRRLQRIEDLEAVRSSLAELALEDQSIITLRHREGLSHAQIAEQLGIEESAAKVRYHRAVKRLGVIIETRARSASSASTGAATTVPKAPDGGSSR